MRSLGRQRGSSSSGAPLVWIALLSALAACASVPTERADEGDGKLPTVAEKAEGKEKRSGFLTFFIDAEGGKIWLELPAPTGERGEVAKMIYLHGLVQGLGSNPIGLDRGQIRDSMVLDIRRLGPRVLFERPNLRFRARSDDPDEQRATRESFATSVLWGGEIAALDDDGRALVDLTPFLLRDAHRVAATLEAAEQGEYSLDESRSAVDLSGCLAFPDNVELEGLVTFSGKKAGAHVSATVPAAESITLLQHHSFVRLPDDGYAPRRFDPRIGHFGVSFLDYAVPLDEEMRTTWIARHRLQKTDPTAERSTAVEPIVYHVDRGAPEPIRSALVDGARWWTEAFERAGFIDAFRVELLPEGAHPLDVRYNVIQWVHRSTRGWSYGNAVSDPRTGEIIKGHVSLGSLRVRQDRRIFEGLLGTETTGSGAPGDPIELALARIRQLSAHEVGHTLGITHNFAASTYGDRASVMDYPAPWVRIDGAGELDPSRAYGVGLGSWDVHTIRYGYSHFPSGADEASELARIVDEGIAAGLTFVADVDARPPGTADPRGALWDNGVDPVAELARLLEVRRLALERFGERNLPPGRPLAELQEVLAPIYFFHRFQLDAAAKVLGGMESDYAVRGDGQVATRIVDGERQRAALAALLEILRPERLDLPEPLLRQLPPRPFFSTANREMFATTTWPAFDALGAAASAADDVVEAILHPSRLGRLVDFHRRDPTLPSLGEVLETLVARAFEAAAVGEPHRSTPRLLALRRIVQRVVVDRLITQAELPTLRADLRAEIEWSLGHDVLARLTTEPDGAPRQVRAHRAALAADVERHLARAATPRPGAAPLPAPPPPGSPIGADLYLGCGLGSSLGAPGT